MLEKIVAEKKKEVAKLIKEYETGITEKRQGAKLNPLSFLKASDGKVQVIAEIKKASPAKGDLNMGLNPVKLAAEYELNGAACISVITEEVFFKGDKHFIPEIKEQVNLPVLRKDFIIHEVQLYETRYLGADLMLLIAAALTYNEILQLTEKALDLGLEPVVEVYSREEVHMLNDLPVKITAVNNRNLRTLEVDIKNSLRLADMLPSSLIRISASGIKSREDMRLLEGYGYHAVLVGESLVTAENPGGKLRELVSYREVGI